MADPHPAPGARPGTGPGTGQVTYEQLARTQEFAELRRRYRRFAFPATVAFISWYTLYVVLSMWAHDFMSHELVGNINVALVFGLLQFLTTFLIAWLYAGYSARNLDPLAGRLEAAFTKGA